MPGLELSILSQPCAIPSQGPITLLGFLISENWQQFSEQFPPLLKERLAAFYGV